MKPRVNGFLRSARRAARLATSREARADARLRRQQLDVYRRQHENLFGDLIALSAARPRRALVIAGGILEFELVLIQALRLEGFSSYVLLGERDRWREPYYGLARAEECHAWDSFSDAPSRHHAEAARAVNGCAALEAFIALEESGVRVGRFSASTAIGNTRAGSLHWCDPEVRSMLTDRLAQSLAAVASAHRLLDVVRPDLVVFRDTVYTPKGELFDVCLARGIDVVAYGAAHRTNGLTFKRYRRESRDHHPASLSADTWRRMAALDWSEAKRTRLREELDGSYARGDWFKARRTQINTQAVAPDDVRAALGLDSRTKTAFICPHILPDGPLVWAETLFLTFEEWFVETVRMACRNDRVNWVIKVHPSRVTRRLGPSGRPVEIDVLEQAVGELPPHIVVMPHDTVVSTRSLLSVMDVCLTVRGTVGIEAASAGVPVVTAARSRYSWHGFTIDSASRAEYLEKLASIDKLEPLSREQRELAGRFAYGTFVARPLVMESVTWEYEAGGGAPRAGIHVRSNAGWRDAPDIAALAEWIGESRDEDFLAVGAR
jgi:hypothetical protein